MNSGFKARRGYPQHCLLFFLVMLGRRVTEHFNMLPRARNSINNFSKCNSRSDDADADASADVRAGGAVIEESLFE